MPSNAVCWLFYVTVKWGLFTDTPGLRLVCSSSLSAGSLHSFPVLLPRRESLVILGLLVTAQLFSSSREFTV